MISVQEGANIRLKCAASGKPQPVVQWAKTDGSAIPMGAWHGRTVFLFLIRDKKKAADDGTNNSLGIANRTAFSKRYTEPHVQHQRGEPESYGRVCVQRRQRDTTSQVQEVHAPGQM